VALLKKKNFSKTNDEIDHSTKQAEITIVTKNDASGPNPTIVSYNASVVKLYYATSSTARFRTEVIFPYCKKRSSLCTTTLALYVGSCKFRSRRIGSGCLCAKVMFVILLPSQISLFIFRHPTLLFVHGKKKTRILLFCRPRPRNPGILTTPEFVVTILSHDRRTPSLPSPAD
jgi:hypothetical protein